jgi:ubiquinone biosynthesis protein UbiJ
MSTADALEAALVELVNRAANATLELDPKAASRLAASEGHRARLIAELPGGVEKSFTLAVVGGRMVFTPHAEAEPNVMVRGSVPALLSMLAGGRSAGPVTIEGDVGVLEELAAVFKGFAPDLAEPLSKLVGETSADGILNAAEAGLALLRSAAEATAASLRRGVGERFATRSRVNVLLDRLDDARERSDRLAARINGLEGARRPNARPERPAP